MDLEIEAANGIDFKVAAASVHFLLIKNFQVRMLTAHLLNAGKINYNGVNGRTDEAP